MENYNCHRTGTNYYPEDKRKRRKINVSCHLALIARNILPDCISRNYARNWPSVCQDSVIEASSKITRKQTGCTDKIQTLSRFWRFTNRISFDKTANVSISSRSNRPPLYEDFMNDVERHVWSYDWIFPTRQQISNSHF